MAQRLMKFLRHRSFVIIALVTLTLCSQVTYAYTSPGTPSGFVNDFAGVLSPDQKVSLENSLATFNASTTNEISIVTIKSLEGDYIEHYALSLFKEWGIGTKKHDNGVLLLVAVDDRKVRIEVGYGLEGYLTDAVSSQIIRKEITPAFKQGDYYTGIRTAVNSMTLATAGAYPLDGEQKKAMTSDALSGILFAFVVVAQFLASILSRSKSFWAGGVIGGVFGALLTYFQVFGSSVVIGSVLTGFFVALGLLFDYVVSREYTKSVASGGHVPWWIGGGSGSSGGYSSSSGGVSFGGFGGGRSGGGGASGGW
jgi:uncharacterized protein